MTKKHTPGPWEVQYNTVIECWDIGKAGEERLAGLLASVLSSNADARLIAAAPELLEALKNLYTATPDNEGGELGRACMKARAAIAKAEGRE